MQGAGGSALHAALGALVSRVLMSPGGGQRAAALSAGECADCCWGVATASRAHVVGTCVSAGLPAMSRACVWR